MKTKNFPLGRVDAQTQKTIGSIPPIKLSKPDNPQPGDMWLDAGKLMVKLSDLKTREITVT